MTCILNHINATVQAFTRITGSICSCVVISLLFFVQKLMYIYNYELIEDTMKERDEANEIPVSFADIYVC